MFFASHPKSRTILNKGLQSTRRLLLESLEDRVVPTLIPDGWLVLSSATYPAGLYAVNPNGTDHTPIPISTPGAFDLSVGLAEDPSSGVLYAADYGPYRSDNFTIKAPAGTMRDHAVMK